MADPIPVELPPGFYGNGNPYNAAGRFATGNLVRFLNGYVRPLGAWRRRKDQLGANLPALFADASIESARNIIQWQDNSGGAHIVVGSNRGLYEISQSGTVTNITPVGFVAGNKDTQEIVGYGVGKYGREAYGTARSGLGFMLKQVASWSFSLFGEVLLAQFRGTGPLYRWGPGVDVKAVPVANAPANAQAVLVTAERIVMLIWEEPRKVQWSDRESMTSWTPTVSNSAGDQTLSGTGKLVELRQVGREILINSTSDAWVGRFLGAPFVYGFESAGNGCGSAAPNSTVVAGGRAYWLHRGGFWTYDGTVHKLPCDVDDWLREVVSFQQLTKTYGFELPMGREVWWFFQSTEGDDCDKYVAFNYEDNTWVYGSWDRTTGMGPSPANQPVYVSNAGHLYDHEVAGLNMPAGYQDFAETGPLEIAGGGQIMGVQFIYPDLVPEASASQALMSLKAAPGPDTSALLEIIGKDWPSPNEPERTYGPYTLDRPIPTTGVRGREIRLRYKGTGPRWRGGKQRMVVVGLGER